MKKHLQILETALVLLRHLKSQIKSLKNRRFNKSKSCIKNLNNSENKKEKTGTRICSKCGQEKPLDKDHYQVVKSFKTGFSFYCNLCNKPPKKDD